MFFWNCENNNELEEIQPTSQIYDTSCRFQEIHFDKQYDALIAITDKSSLKVLIDYGRQVYYEKEHTDFDITCSEFNKQKSCILLGTNTGKIIVYNWPLFENDAYNSSFMISVDNSPLTRIISTMNLSSNP